MTTFPLLRFLVMLAYIVKAHFENSICDIVLLISTFAHFDYVLLLLNVEGKRSSQKNTIEHTKTPR